MKLRFLVGNVHTWGKPTITKSGDLDFICSLAEEYARRQGQFEYDIEYRCIENLEDIKVLYPKANFVPFMRNHDDCYIVPILDARGGRFADSKLATFFEELSEVNFVTFDIVHKTDFYPKQIKQLKDQGKIGLADALQKALLSAKSIGLFHPSRRLEIFDITGDTSQYHYFGDLVTYQANREKDLVFGKPCKLKFITFNRPADYKGYHLWLKRMLDRPDLANESVYICRIDMLKDIDFINKEVAKCGFNYEKFHTFSSITQFLKALPNIPNDGMPRIIVSEYFPETESFKRLISNIETYMVNTDYEYSIEDYLVFENALVNSVYDGLALRWNPYSIQSMRNVHGQNSKAAQEAEYLNNLNVEEQREYLKDRLSLSKFVTNLLLKVSEIQ